MARSDIRFREAYNNLLTLCEEIGPEADLPSEEALAELTDTSRTVIRAALQRLSDEKIVDWSGRQKVVLRTPSPRERLEIERPQVNADDLETAFFDWILRFDVSAGTSLNVAKLARQFNVPNHAIQEFLAGLSRLGLVKRRRQGGWLLLGFTSDFALELTDYRTALECYALRKFSELPDSDPLWDKLSTIKKNHIALKQDIETRFQDFSKLDEQFHGLINASVRNRFAKESQKIISMIFHYHYMWDKSEEKTRNSAAVDEHLAVIDALEARDFAAAEKALLMHLETSKSTLVSSLRSHKHI